MILPSRSTFLLCPMASTFITLTFSLVSLVLRLATKVLCQSLSLQQELILYHLFLGIYLCMLIASLGDFKNREPSIILKVVLKTDIEVTLRIRF